MDKDFKIADIQRVLSSLMSFGIVSAVHPRFHKAKVRISKDLETGYLPMMRRKAKAARESWPLEVGEQVLCFFVNGNITQGVIMGSICTEDMAPETDNHLLNYGDGTKYEYDKSSKKMKVLLSGRGSLEVKIPSGKILIDAEDDLKCASHSITIKAEASVTIKAESAVIDSKNISLGAGALGSVVTTESICAFTGLPHPKGSSICRAAR